MKQFLKNVWKVMVSKGVSLLAGLAVGLLLPKALGVSGYGYLRTYSLYLVYATFLHFGFVDGILLKYAGRDFDELKTDNIRSLSLMYIVLELLIGTIIAATGLLFFREDVRFILLMLGINAIITNLTTYFQFVSQAVQHFSLYSLLTFISSALKVIVIGAFFLLFMRRGAVISYRSYLWIITAADMLILVIFMIRYRALWIGKRSRIRSVIPEARGIFSSGIILTVAYQAGHLLLSLDRQFVSVIYPIEVYSVYSFAYSIISLITTVISSVAVVLFPMLKSLPQEKATQSCERAVLSVAIVAGAAAGLFFPLEPFIGSYLSEYTASVNYLRILMPTVIPISCISIVLFTYYKLVNKNNVYFVNSLIMLAAGTVLNGAAQLIFHDPSAISWASVITVIIWFILSSRYFAVNHSVKWFGNFILIVFLMAVYYTCMLAAFTWWLSMILYYCVYAAMILIIIKGSFSPGHI